MNIDFSWSIPRLLVAQSKKYWHYYLGAVLALIALHYTQSFLPFYAKELADLVSLDKPIPTEKFFLLALGIIVFRTSSRLLFFTPARFLEKDMRVSFYKKLENTLPSRFSSVSSGQLFQVVYSDIEQIRALVGFAILQVGNVAIALAVLLPQLHSVHSSLLYSLMPMLISFILFTVIVGKSRTYYRKTQDLAGEVQHLIMETYSGKESIKNYGAEESFFKLFKEKSLSELVNFYKSGIAIAFSIPLIPLGVGLSLVWGGRIILEQGLTSSDIILLSGFIFLLLEPLAFMSWIGIVFASSSVSWKRINEFNAKLTSKSSMETYLIDHNRTEKGDPGYNLEFWELNLILKSTPLSGM